ncbi:MAG: acyl-CoA dehydrogenase family protein [Acidimicrobiia bacterium]
MDFALTGEQELLRESTRALLARECPTSLVRAHMDDLGAAAPLWEHLRSFSALGVGPAVDVCLFMEELGYICAPSPFFASAVLAAPVLDAIGSDLLPAVLGGELSATVAIAGPEGNWVLSDDEFKSFVPDAATGDAVLATDGAGVVSRLDAPDLRRLETIDPSRPLYDVRTDGPSSIVGTITAAALEGIVARATVALSAELVGTARRLFEMALAYAKDRYQFGVPIGSFQAIQHKLADMSLDVERAWSAVYYAAMTVDADDADRPRAVHVAKAAAGEAAKRAAKDGIQIHGGIGYTWEHDLHLFMRRAFGTEALLGTTGWHHDRLADLLIG